MYTYTYIIRPVVQYSLRSAILFLSLSIYPQRKVNANKNNVIIIVGVTLVSDPLHQIHMNAHIGVTSRYPVLEQ